MNKATQIVDAARLKQRIRTMIGQNDEINKDQTDARRERNSGAAYQVRSIAGTVNNATFGSACAPNCTVGP